MSRNGQHTDPKAIRLALFKRFPCWTQRWWNWLTAIVPPGEPPPSSPWSVDDHVKALGLTWLVAVALGLLTQFSKQGTQPPMV